VAVFLDRESAEKPEFYRTSRRSGSSWAKVSYSA
jgi:hypothetical protein